MYRIRVPRVGPLTRGTRRGRLDFLDVPVPHDQSRLEAIRDAPVEWIAWDFRLTTDSASG